MTAARDDEPMGELVSLRPDDGVQDAEVVEVAEAPTTPARPRPAVPTRAGTVLAPSKARAALERFNDRPPLTPTRVVATSKWWARHGGKALLTLTTHSPIIVARELGPILRGLVRVVKAFAEWLTCAKYEGAIRDAEPKDRHKAQKDAEDRKKGRRLAAAAGFAVLGGGTWWLIAAQPLWAIAAGLVAVAALDLIGRAGRAPQDKPVILPTGPITEGVPLSSLRAEVAKSLEEQGLEAAVVMPAPVAHGWTIPYHSRQAIEDEHLRALERELQIRPRSITQIRAADNAARGELRVMLSDPLAAVIESPEYPAGSLSIYRPLQLGVSADHEPWCESFLRTHFSLIGASQSGKSSCLWEIVYLLRLCPEVELDGIDLTDGPAFSACRRAFRRRATDKDGAQKVLADAVKLIKQRAAELSRLAEADDTPDDYDEKHQPTAAEPQRTVLIDEFAQVSADEDLLPLVEYILRYGAKCAVNLGIAGQGTSVDDFGKSVIRGQIMLKILFACARQDVLTLFGKDARDQGFRPDLLEVSNGDDPRDAGKCFVQSARSKTPMMRRAHRLEQAEVRRRDRMLGGRNAQAGSVEAVEVPHVLAVLERAVGGREHVPTAEVLDALGEEWNAKRLSLALAEYHLGPDQHPRTKARGYWRQDIEKAIRDL